MRARSEFTEAIVLRLVDYGDSDRIVTLLTTRYGKVSALARAARRSTKRFHALGPFCVLRADVSLGSGDMGTLLGAELSRPFPAILASLDKLSVAGAACELVREALPMLQPEPEVFSTTVALLGALEITHEGLHALLLGFSWRVIALCGFAPGVDACGACGRQPRRGQAGMFDPALGALCCSACGGRGLKLSGDVLLSLRRALGPEWFNAFDAIDSGELQRLRRVTDAFIEHRLERKLHGVDFLNAVDSDGES